MYNFHHYNDDRVRTAKDYEESGLNLMDELELLTIKFKDKEEAKTFTYNILTNQRAVKKVFNILRCSPMMEEKEDKIFFTAVSKDVNYLYNAKDYVLKDEGKEITFAHKAFTVKRDSDEVALGRNYHKMLFDKGMIYMPNLDYEDLFNLMGCVIGNLPFLRDTYINSSKISLELKSAFMDIMNAVKIYQDDVPQWYYKVFDQKTYDKIDESEKDAFF